MITRYRTLWVVLIIASAIVGIQAVSQQGPGPKPAEEKFANLKVLPKNISHDDLMKQMHMYCKALNVHCTECHAAKPGPSTHPDLDFASDAKSEKETARSMIKMVDAINHKYLGKMNGGMMEQINCVTCHNGRLTPIVSVDSLPKMPMMH